MDIEFNNIDIVFDESTDPLESAKVIVRVDNREYTTWCARTMSGSRTKIGLRRFESSIVGGGNPVLSFNGYDFFYEDSNPDNIYASILIEWAQTDPEPEVEPETGFLLLEPPFPSSPHGFEIPVGGTYDIKVTPNWGDTPGTYMRHDLSEIHSGIVIVKE